MSEMPNLMDPQVRLNPYPYYVEMRKKPVFQTDPGGLWVVTRYEDALSVLKNPTLSSAAWTPLMQPAWIPSNPFAHSLVVLDAPVHTKLRNLIGRAFTSAGLARMESRVRLIADVLAEQVAERREVDFIRDFALALTAHVIGDMLGLPAQLHPRLKQWSDDLINIPATQAPEEQTRIKTSISMMERFLTKVIDSRRQFPGDDMISELVKAQIDGQSLTTDELLSFGFLLVVAGMETTINLLGHSLIILANQPELFERVTAERGRLIPQFIEESLRMEPPAHHIFRLTTVPIELGGTRIPAGNMILVVVGAATHDERQFERPEEFRLDRDNKPASVVFGHGAHFCLGAMLARMEARYGLEALLLRMRGVSMKKDHPIQWGIGLNSRTLSSAHMVFDPK